LKHLQQKPQTRVNICNVRGSFKSWTKVKTPNRNCKFRKELQTATALKMRLIFPVNKQMQIEAGNIFIYAWKE
jgi:hypothetical protein